MFLYRPHYDISEVKLLLENYAKFKGWDVGANQVLQNAQTLTGVPASELLKNIKGTKDIEANLYIGELPILIAYSEQKYGKMVEYQDIFVREILDRGVSPEKAMLNISKEVLASRVKTLAYNLNLKNKLDLGVINIINVKNARGLNEYEQTQKNILIERIECLDEQIKKQIAETSTCYSLVDLRKEEIGEPKYPIDENEIRNIKFEKYLLAHLCYFGSRADVIKCFEDDWHLTEMQAIKLTGQLLDQYKSFDKTIVDESDNKYLKVCLQAKKENPTQEPGGESGWGL